MTEERTEQADDNPLIDPTAHPDQNPDSPGDQPRRGFDEPGSETVGEPGETRPSLDTDGNPDRISTE